MCKMTNRQWSAADAQYIRNVFSQPSGQKFLELVKGLIPRIKTKGSKDAALMEAWEKQGAEEFFEKMLKLIDVEPEFYEGPQQVDLTMEGD